MDEPENTVEKRVLLYLQSQPDGPAPFINRLRETHDIYPGGDERRFRIFYLDFCNGGDLSELRAILVNRKWGISYCLLLRLAKQMLIALNYMYTRNEPILHRHLNPKNIFCLWSSAGEVSFYLGDFGFATTGHQLVGSSGSSLEDVQMLSKLLEDFSDLEGPAPGGSRDSDAVRDLYFNVLGELTLIGSDESEVALPEFSPLIEMLATFQDEGVIAEPFSGYNFHNAHQRTADSGFVRPAYYDTQAECLAPHLRGTAVHGPWHVSRVWPNGAGQPGGVGADDLTVQMSLAFVGEAGVLPPPPPGPRVVDWEAAWQHRPYMKYDDARTDYDE